jgi:hypothetical protein
MHTVAEWDGNVDPRVLAHKLGTALDEADELL